MQIAQSEAVKNVKVKVKDKTEDVRETWETSQNPCVQAAEVLRVLYGHGM